MSNRKMPIIKVLAADVPADVDMLIAKYELPPQKDFWGRVQMLSYIARMYGEKALKDFYRIHPDKSFFADFSEEPQYKQDEDDKVVRHYKVPPTFFVNREKMSNCCGMGFNGETFSDCAGCGGSCSMANGESKNTQPKAQVNGFVVGTMFVTVAALLGVIIAKGD